MVKIRLMRIGAKKRPFYRVVAVDERAKRTGGYIELLGTYNPLTEPHEINLKQDRIDHWIKQGAQPSDGYLRIIGKAPQRPPRKPKKSHSADSASVATSAKEAASRDEGKETAPAEEKPAEETPKSSEPEVTGEVQSAPEESISNNSASEQTRSEVQNENSESEQTEPSGTSVTDEVAPTKETKE